MNNISYAIDWAHTKSLTIYDGKKGTVLDRKSLLKKLAGESIKKVKSNGCLNSASTGAGGESNTQIKSTAIINPPAPIIILEQGCPLSLIYDILKIGCQVKTIANRATQDYRVKHSIEKSDENDARIIYELANNGASLTPVSLEDSQIRLLDLYQRYKRYQKARVAMMNMRKAYIRQFGDGVKSTHYIQSNNKFNNPSLVSIGDGESIDALKSIGRINPSPAIEGERKSILSFKSTPSINPLPSDGTLPYDISVDTLKDAEDNCLKKIIKLSPPIPRSLKIRGLGPRIWGGIHITANPINFPTLSSYLRYCGLVNLDQLNHKWNRHARMLYHMLADEVMKQRDETFRPIYDKCKADIAKRYPEYTKMHIHNSALNRTATFLAKCIYSGAQGEEKK